MFTCKPTVKNDTDVALNNYVVLEAKHSIDSPQLEDKLMEAFLDLSAQPNKKIMAETTQNGSEKTTILKIVNV